TYTWTAAYEPGADPNYAAAGPTACNDPAETFTVAPATPSITTQVQLPAPGLGGTSIDAATLVAPPGITVPPAPAPTGLIRFRLFGPDNATCDPAGPVHSTSTTPVDHFGPPPYLSAASAPITAAGPYTWVAVYEHGADPNYTDSLPTACGDPAETFIVGNATPTITTVATPPAGLGGTSTDAATLVAPPGVIVPPAPAPTGLIRFRLFGPDNPTCDVAGPIHSTSTAPVDHFGPPPYASAVSAPITTAGTYTWTAAFESGDPNYTDSAPTACLDPAETFTVAPATPSITTVVTAPTPDLGGTSTDTATLAAPPGITVPPAPAPTGLIRFRLFNTATNPTCDPAGAVHSTSTTPVDHFGPPPYTSAASAPITVAGTYTWTAAYEPGADPNY
ncbi:MAG: hypothetical protein LC708_03780, partial [Actinobacteria bacterium]|nr:hypothetical protein [Actinomycetota bacterium]